MKVVVDSIQSASSFNIIKSIRNKYEDAFIIGTGRNAVSHDYAKSMVDHYENIAEIDCQYVNKLFDICESNKVDYVISLSSLGAQRLENAPTVSRFNSIGTKLFEQPGKTLGILASRTEMKEFLNSIDVLYDGPIFTRRDLNMYRPDLTPLQFPCFVKSDKIVADDTLVTKKIITKLVRSWNEVYTCDDVLAPILCEFLYGTDFIIDCMSDTAGKMVASCVRRVDAKNSLGSCVVSVLDSEELSDFAKKIVEALEIKGPSEVRLFKGDNIKVVYSVKIRISNTIGFAVSSGFDIFSMIKAALDREEIPKPVLTYGSYNLFPVIRNSKEFLYPKIEVQPIVEKKWWQIWKR